MVFKYCDIPYQNEMLNLQQIHRNNLSGQDARHLCKGWQRQITFHLLWVPEKVQFQRRDFEGNKVGILPFNFSIRLRHYLVRLGIILLRLLFLCSSSAQNTFNLPITSWFPLSCLLKEDALVYFWIFECIGSYWILMCFINDF